MRKRPDMCCNEREGERGEKNGRNKSRERSSQKITLGSFFLPLDPQKSDLEKEEEKGAQRNTHVLHTIRKQQRFFSHCSTMGRIGLSPFSQGMYSFFLLNPWGYRDREKSVQTHTMRYKDIWLHRGFTIENAKNAGFIFSQRNALLHFSPLIRFLSRCLGLRDRITIAYNERGWEKKTSFKGPFGVGEGGGRKCAIGILKTICFFQSWVHERKMSSFSGKQFNRDRQWFLAAVQNSKLHFYN